MNKPVIEKLASNFDKASSLSPHFHILYSCKRSSRQIPYMIMVMAEDQIYQSSWTVLNFLHNISNFEVSHSMALGRVHTYKSQPKI